MRIINRTSAYLRLVVAIAFAVGSLPKCAEALTVVVGDFVREDGGVLPSFVSVGLRPSGSITTRNSFAQISTDCPGACASLSIQHTEGNSSSNAEFEIEELLGGAVQIQIPFRTLLDDNATYISAFVFAQIYLVVDQPARVEAFGNMSVATTGFPLGGREIDVLQFLFPADDYTIGERQGVLRLAGAAGSTTFSEAESEFNFGDIILVPGQRYRFDLLVRAYFRSRGSIGFVPSELVGVGGLRFTPVPEPSTSLLIGFGLAALGVRKRTAASRFHRSIK